MPLFIGNELQGVQDLCIGLSQVLFPVVLVLGLNGLTVGILNAYDHFAIPALSPLVWNMVILAFLVASHHMLTGDAQLYGYAAGVLAGTVVQFSMALPQLYGLGFRLQVRGVSFRDRRVLKVLTLMLPVTIGLGLINFNVLINSTLGSLVSPAAPRAIDAAFRIYMLPQGLFSVAIATVLFPTLSRFAARRDLDGLRALLGNGMRQILLLLVPAAVATLVLAEPITRLIYQHGAFGTSSTDAVSTALFWFSFSLPTSGLNLLLTRTFFSVQRPWITTWISAVNLAVNAGVSIALYAPFGIAGIVIGTAVGSATMSAVQIVVLRRLLHGRLEMGRTAAALARMAIASALLGVTTWAVWHVADAALGRGLLGQTLAVCAGLGAGAVVYAAAVLAMRIPEAGQIARLVRRRLGHSG
jgi:putative peptidoglycan lipid II flippase